MLLVILTDDFRSGILFRINVIISNNVLKLSFHCVNRESLCKSYARSRESSCCNENCVLSRIKLTFLTEFCILEKPILFWNALSNLQTVHWEVCLHSVVSSIAKSTQIMEGMEFLSTMVESLSGRKILFVYCIDTAAKSSIKFNAVPCFQFNYVLGHCGFPDMLRRRFIVFFVDSQNTRDTFDGTTSPAVIEIQPSCLIKVKHLFLVMFTLQFWNQY